MLIAVAGATGVVGRHVVTVAQERGHHVVPLARSTGVDLAAATDAGEPADQVDQLLADRLTGVGAVVDVTSTTAQSRAGAEAFFGTVSRRLLAAERAAGVGHHLALSIVGVDDVGLGYYAGKRLQESVVADGDQPWSLLRATQFHEFAEQVLGFARVGPVSLVPRMPVRPVAAREVAEALVDLVEVGPSGRVPDLGGPDVLTLSRLARRVVRARGRRRVVVAVPPPGRVGRGLREGALLPAPDARLGRTTFEEWLGS